MLSPSISVKDNRAITVVRANRAAVGFAACVQMGSRVPIAGST